MDVKRNELVCGRGWGYRPRRRRKEPKRRHLNLTQNENTELMVSPLRVPYSTSTLLLFVVLRLRNCLRITSVPLFHLYHHYCDAGETDSHERAAIGSPAYDSDAVYHRHRAVHLPGLGALQVLRLPYKYNMIQLFEG